MFVQINIVLGVFNLIPIPPLDGSRVVGGFLPRGAYEKWVAVDRYGFIILIAVLVIFQSQFSAALGAVIDAVWNLHLLRLRHCEAYLRPLELDLDVYQGPFDLLLSLVFKEEIDLLEVPLFEVISAYLDELEAKGATADWDEMSEFLLLMSLLVEIKSRLLLPGAEPVLEAELTPEQARDQLLARLFEYSKFKAAAGRLRELGEQQLGVRAAAPERAPDRPAARARRHRRQRGRHATARIVAARAREPA